MVGIVQLIHCKPKSFQRSVTIKLRGRNVLIVGQNGAGKTSLLIAMFEELKTYFNHRFREKPQYITQVQHHLQYTRDYPDHAKSNLEAIKAIREHYRKARAAGFLTVRDAEGFHEDLQKHRVALHLFKAHRKADISKVTSAGASIKEGQTRSDRGLSSELEQHLVNLKVRAALANLASQDDGRLAEVEAWFEKFERDVQYLFEDPGLRLKFDADRMKYWICQEGKADYSFQELSSGYSAIFDIFGDLIVRAQYLNVTPQELRGIIFIDEIDAHLHVSLQRKILPFLIKSFPRIQFIVTTHSPFVLSSVDDVLIYDVSSGKSALDLSMYSVEAILEGLLGVPPISKKLEDKIKELSACTSEHALDLNKASALIEEITPFVDSLDEESRMFYELSKNRVLRFKKGAPSV